ncbi:hypothetical protein FI667_g9419, partial [Globisporangium splendens]
MGGNDHRRSVNSQKRSRETSLPLQLDHASLQASTSTAKLLRVKKWCSWSVFVASTTLLLACFAAFAVATAMDLAVSTCSSMDLELPDRLFYFFTSSPRPIALRDQRFELQTASLKSNAKQPQPLVLTENLALTNDSMCAPGVLDMRRRSGSHRFHTMLASIGPLPPPVFSGNDMRLCNETTRFLQDAAYCLPISGRHDSPFCDGPDRMELLTRSNSKCFASVLHLLTADVYDVLQSRDNDEIKTSPLLIFQSLLGAVQSKSTLPSAMNASIAYFSSPPRQRSSILSRVQLRLWTRGYHMFRQDGDALWRVCVAPTHPLASSLYDPNAVADTRRLHFPQVTLHHVEAAPNAQWRVERGGAKSCRGIPHAKFFPLTKVQVNGVAYVTIADPKAFLEQEYGANYLTATFAH